MTIARLCHVPCRTILHPNIHFCAGANVHAVLDRYNYNALYQMASNDLEIGAEELVKVGLDPTEKLKGQIRLLFRLWNGRGQSSFWQGCKGWGTMIEDFSVTSRYTLNDTAEVHLIILLRDLHCNSPKTILCKQSTWCIDPFAVAYRRRFLAEKDRNSLKHYVWPRYPPN